MTLSYPTGRAISRFAGEESVRQDLADGTPGCAVSGRRPGPGWTRRAAVGAAVVAGPGSRPGGGVSVVCAGRAYRDRDSGAVVDQPGPGGGGAAGRRDRPADLPQGLPGRRRHPPGDRSGRQHGGRRGPGVRGVPYDGGAVVHRGRPARRRSRGRSATAPGVVRGPAVHHPGGRRGAGDQQGQGDPGVDRRGDPPAAAVRAQGPRRPRRGDRYRAGGGVPPTGHDDRQGGSAFRCQR